jgi:hypothetical protein
MPDGPDRMIRPGRLLQSDMQGQRAPQARTSPLPSHLRPDVVIAGAGSDAIMKTDRVLFSMTATQTRLIDDSPSACTDCEPAINGLG